MSEAIYTEAGNQVTMVKVRSKPESDPIES
jgi:hypothetical protein